MFLLSLVFIVSCTTILQPEEKVIITRIGARHAGAEMVKVLPGNILTEISTALDEIISNKTASPDNLFTLLKRTLIETALQKTDDPLLIADCHDLLDLVEARLPEIHLQSEQIKLIQAVARGLKEGIQIQPISKAND